MGCLLYTGNVVDYVEGVGGFAICINMEFFDS